MSLRSFASPLALATAAALSLGSAAHAQTTVGNQQVSEEDLPAVTQYCAALEASGGNTAPTTMEDLATHTDTNPDPEGSLTANENAANGTEAGAGTADGNAAGTTGDAAAGNAANPDAVQPEGTPGVIAQTTVDLNAITLEDCQAAGLGIE